MNLRIEEKKNNDSFPVLNMFVLQELSVTVNVKCLPQKEKKTKVKGIRPNLLFQRIR